ncbi:MULTISPECIES: signal recognition particle-docking protein FtsY [unclassified Rhodanobacter]|uniref:signal recognition particle-docking protein FtsY n=1 Tax=unclassified Rhodanobacter TaxID=2621553 RepID=UPI0007AA4115|nr:MULTISPECIES: signal recognition particle-docking protein FtsY [unclassified Rhodanobacter]KZC18137.1 signal recognition particle-docking protein FtsY [Rhodanobacter sp. FW104-R8]KZC25793.1 signal recognition particle-docking protein FtsY [Rhodanobacter sp. FW510-T8]KZC33556.1 signal recognition particle-docking protein FtsY [Rhodanobacter sp. FW510-R10]
MLKFWKKKPTEKDAGQPAAKAPAADAVAPEGDEATLHEALAEIPAPADTRPGHERFVAPAGEPAAAPAPARRSWRERLAGNAFSRGLGALFMRHPKLDDDLLDELETTLITADVGIEASTELVENLRRRMHRREFADAQALLAALRQALVALLKPVEQPLEVRGKQPFVVLVVGINGAGKTTTIGKLARRWRDERRAVMLAAGDTFRAAAVEQLKTWGERNQVPVISQGQDADAASVIFDALQAARSRGTDVLVADTAGRLHTQGGLMDELGKIARVLKKLDADAPHEVLMVIDGTTGQNAVSQVRQFRQIVGVTGLVVTKLDGTAKGGVVFALAREFGLPIRFVGLGESATDLRVFEAEAFVDGLLPASLGGEAPGHD